jgi:serine/threonine protein phosphatase 1
LAFDRIRSGTGDMKDWRARLRGLFAGPSGRAVAAARSSVPADTLVIAIGDLHGRIDLLERLWTQLQPIARKSDCRHRVLVFLGDYVDRGPQSAALVDRLLEGFDGFDTVFLRGNHEETMLRFLSDPSVGPLWQDFGGIDTLRSYGIEHAPGSSWADTRAAFALALPEHHHAFFKNLKLHHAVGDYVFVHAGLRPHTRLEDQSEHDLLWIREDFLESQASFGRIVVHGHTPTQAPEVRNNRIGIDTGAFYTGKLTALVLEGRQRRLVST